MPGAGRATTDPTARFFEDLDEAGHNEVLEKASGTLRFDLTDDGKRVARWLVEIEKGDVAVSHKNAKADCVVRTDKKLFDRLVTGKANPFTAFLRAEVDVDGDMGLMASFIRIFPGPPTRA